jgi:hypothetical protein
VLDSELLQDSRVSGNTAALDGGINNNAGTTTLVDSTLMTTASLPTTPLARATVAAASTTFPARSC